MLKRCLCPVCRENPVAINYIRNGVTHYRNKCASCIRKNKNQRLPPPGWVRSGYKKKANCELCNFKFELASQSNVYYIDGNLKNNNWVNLKTICLNCQQKIYAMGVGWRAGPIVPDF